MPSLIVHGGAGAWGSQDEREAAEAGCAEAVRVGRAVMLGGGSALDAVVAAVASLEDNPCFNAGLGSALNFEGDVETDASVMRGEDGGAGAVGGLTDVKNPIAVARMVMERTPHVLLVGAGARRFAASEGVALLPPGALVTERARHNWTRLREAGGAPGHGTVGAVARDAAGHVAAATSTGGTALKMPGRVGDSALIGCGTFADDARGACSCTGLGEAIIKATLARRAVERLGGDEEPSVVAQRLIRELARFGGDGGLILVDARGRLGYALSSARMARAWVDADAHHGTAFGPRD